VEGDGDAHMAGSNAGQDAEDDEADGQRVTGYKRMHDGEPADGSTSNGRHGAGSEGHLVGSPGASDDAVASYADDDADGGALGVRMVMPQGDRPVTGRGSGIRGRRPRTYGPAVFAMYDANNNLLTIPAAPNANVADLAAALGTSTGASGLLGGVSGTPKGGVAGDSDAPADDASAARGQGDAATAGGEPAGGAGGAASAASAADGADAGSGAGTTIITLDAAADVLNSVSAAANSDADLLNSLADDRDPHMAMSPHPRRDNAANRHMSLTGFVPPPRKRAYVSVKKLQQLGSAAEERTFVQHLKANVERRTRASIAETTAAVAMTTVMSQVALPVLPNGLVVNSFAGSAVSSALGRTGDGTGDGGGEGGSLSDLLGDDWPAAGDDGAGAAGMEAEGEASSAGGDAGTVRVGPYSVPAGSLSNGPSTAGRAGTARRSGGRAAGSRANTQASGDETEPSAPDGEDNGSNVDL
jgi:hypothetical protein